MQVTFLGGFAAFESPDGRYLYYAKGRSVPSLWRKLLDGGAEEAIVEELKAGFWGYWAVVRNGIYYFDDPGPNGRGVYFHNLATHRARIIAAIEKRPMVGDSTFAISPDGRYLLYTQIDQSGSDILIADYE